MELVDRISVLHFCGFGLYLIMKNFSDNQYCFVCGLQNPQGLKFKFNYNKTTDEVTSDISFADHFQGWAGVVHGGLVSTVLDEIMVKTTEARGFICVTAEICIKFKNPARINTPYQCSGKILDIKRKLVFTESKMVDTENNLIARAEAKFFITGEIQASK
jgi:uncharacterized protein (TIGR00369 family)